MSEWLHIEIHEPKITVYYGRGESIDFDYEADSIKPAQLFAIAPDLYEFVEGVARGPYPDSDLASLMETYCCRARALLDKIRD